MGLTPGARPRCGVGRRARADGRFHKGGTLTGSVMRIVRTALVFLVPAVLMVALVPSGSAKPPASPVRNFEVCIQNGGTLLPGCLSFGAHSSFAGGTHAASVQITLANDSTSTANIGSAN